MWFATLDVAVATLKYHKSRSLLMVLSVTAAIFTFTVLDAFDYSMGSGESSVSGQRLIVSHRQGIMQMLPMSHIARVNDVPGVAEVGHATWSGLYYREPRNMLMSFAVDGPAWFVQHPEMEISAEAKTRFLERPNAFLASEALAAKYSWNVGDVVPFGSILFRPPEGEKAWGYTLAGTFNSGDAGGGRNYLLTHYDFLNENRTSWKDTVGTLIVVPDEGTTAAELAQRIDSELTGSAAPTSTDTDQQFHNQFFAQFGDVRRIIAVVVAVTLASLMLIVGSAMTLSVCQQAQAFGVLRVLGYRKKRLLGVVLAQQALVVSAGTAIGVAVAAGFTRALTRLMPNVLPSLTLPVPTLTDALLIGVGVIVITSLIPGWLALRVRPIEALRGADA